MRTVALKHSLGINCSSFNIKKCLKLLFILFTNVKSWSNKLLFKIHGPAYTILIARRKRLFEIPNPLLRRYFTHASVHFLLKTTIVFPPTTVYYYQSYLESLISLNYNVLHLQQIQIQTVYQLPNGCAISLDLSYICMYGFLIKINRQKQTIKLNQIVGEYSLSYLAYSFIHEINFLTWFCVHLTSISKIDPLGTSFEWFQFDFKYLTDWFFYVNF